MADTRTPDEIERDIERERAELGQTVDELQDRFSPDRIMREVARGFSEHGSDFGEAITQSVKRNPVALAVTGIGLAWLMSGRSWDEDKHAIMPSGRNDAGADSYGTGRSGALPSRGYAAGTPPRPRGGLGYPDRSADLADRAGDGVLTDGRRSGGYSATDHWLYADDDDYWDGFDDHDDDHDGPGIGDRVSGAGAKARAGAQSAADSVSSGAAGVRDAAGHGAASVRDGMSSAGHSAAERARRIRRRLHHGTETMTEEARERIVAARWAAVRARRSAARQARHGADAVSQFFEDNPLVAGGLAVAAGAILASALPRTKQEDDYFGEYSDNAYSKAERIFEAERQKAMKVADAAAGTAQEVLDEERNKIDDQAPGDKSAAEHIADEVRDGVTKVADAGRNEANKQKLGDTKS